MGVVVVVLQSLRGILALCLWCVFPPPPPPPLLLLLLQVPKISSKVYIEKEEYVMSPLVVNTS